MNTEPMNLQSGTLKKYRLEFDPNSVSWRPVGVRARIRLSNDDPNTQVMISKPEVRCPASPNGFRISSLEISPDKLIVSFQVEVNPKALPSAGSHEFLLSVRPSMPGLGMPGDSLLPPLQRAFQVEVADPCRIRLDPSDPLLSSSGDGAARIAGHLEILKGGKDWVPCPASDFRCEIKPPNPKPTPLGLEPLPAPSAEGSTLTKKLLLNRCFPGDGSEVEVGKLEWSAKTTAGAVQQSVGVRVATVPIMCQFEVLRGSEILMTDRRECQGDLFNVTVPSPAGQAEPSKDMRLKVTVLSSHPLWVKGHHSVVEKAISGAGVARVSLTKDESDPWARSQDLTLSNRTPKKATWTMSLGKRGWTTVEGIKLGELIDVELLEEILEKGGVIRTSLAGGFAQGNIQVNPKRLNDAWARIDVVGPSRKRIFLGKATGDSGEIVIEVEKPCGLSADAGAHVTVVEPNLRARLEKTINLASFAQGRLEQGVTKYINHVLDHLVTSSEKKIDTDTPFLTRVKRMPLFLEGAGNLFSKLPDAVKTRKLVLQRLGDNVADGLIEIVMGLLFDAIGNRTDLIRGPRQTAAKNAAQAGQALVRKPASEAMEKYAKGLDDHLKLLDDQIANVSKKVKEIAPGAGESLQGLTKKVEGIKKEIRQWEKGKREMVKQANAADEIAWRDIHTELQASLNAVKKNKQIFEELSAEVANLENLRDIQQIQQDFAHRVLTAGRSGSDREFAIAYREFGKVMDVALSETKEARLPELLDRAVKSYRQMVPVDDITVLHREVRAFAGSIDDVTAKSALLALANELESLAEPSYSHAWEKTGKTIFEMVEESGIRPVVKWSCDAARAAEGANRMSPFYEPSTDVAGGTASLQPSDYDALPDLMKWMASWVNWVTNWIGSWPVSMFEYAEELLKQEATNLTEQPHALAMAELKKAGIERDELVALGDEAKNSMHQLTQEASLDRLAGSGSAEAASNQFKASVRSAAEQGSQRVQRQSEEMILRLCRDVLDVRHFAGEDFDSSSGKDQREEARKLSEVAGRKIRSYLAFESASDNKSYLLMLQKQGGKRDTTYQDLDHAIETMASYLANGLRVLGVVSLFIPPGAAAGLLAMGAAEVVDRFTICARIGVSSCLSIRETNALPRDLILLTGLWGRCVLRSRDK